MVYPDLCITLISQIYSAAQRALDCYDQAMRRLKSGDWAGFGTEMNAMRDVLEKLSRDPTAPSLQRDESVESEAA